MSKEEFTLGTRPELLGLILCSKGSMEGPQLKFRLSDFQPEFFYMPGLLFQPSHGTRPKAEHTQPPQPTFVAEEDCRSQPTMYSILWKLRGYHNPKELLQHNKCVECGYSEVRLQSQADLTLNPASVLHDTVTWTYLWAFVSSTVKWSY